MNQAELIVRLEDMRAANLCVSGARQWFASNNLDFRDFAKNGIQGHTLASLNDPLANRAIAAAEARTVKGNG